MKKILVSLASLSALLVLSACGGSGTSAKSNSQSLVDTTVAAAQGSGSFGAPITTTAGDLFTLSTPTTFTPGQFASGQLPGQVYNGIEISITPKATLNLSSMIVAASTPAGACADILDGDNKYQGAPQTDLAAGTPTTFKWALSCPGKAGDALTFLLTNNNISLVQVVGKLA